MSRFAVDPNWLIYLPPTMSPTETTQPSRACSSTRPRRSPTTAARASRTVVCEEKHMGSRAVVVVCRDEDAARAALRRRRRRRSAIVLHAHRPAASSTTRRSKRAAARRGSARRSTAPASGSELDTDWVCLDCELMPWSAKAQELLREQYAAGRRRGAGGAARDAVARARASRGARRRRRRRSLARYDASARAGRRATSTPTAATAGRSTSLDDLQLAPFHLLASEGAVHVDKDHVWHMETLAAVCAPTIRRCCCATRVPRGRR